MRRLTKILFITLVCLTLGAVLGACGTNPTKLAAPSNLKINGTTLTWDTVENASGYLIQVNTGTAVDNGTSTSYSLSGLTTPGTYSLKVQAKGDGTNYSNSDWSAAKTYTVVDETLPKLATPSNLQINDTTLTWDAVTNAGGYMIQINGEEPIDNGTSASYSLAELTEPGAYSIKVQAKGDNTNYADSNWSAAKVYTIVDETLPELATPSNLQISDTTLTWDAVTNASGYMIQINSEEPIDNGTLTSYSLEELTEPGEYSIKVLAKGDNTNYADSNWSAAKTYTVEEL